MKQRTFHEEMQELFGGKVYRLSLSSGCSCPNRDGTVGTGGCIFCSGGGSGEFAAQIPQTGRGLPPAGADAITAPVDVSARIGAATASLDLQIEDAKRRVSRKLSGNFAGYMAYFQSYSNTYGPTEPLRQLFLAALNREEILALSIGTRPDCLPPETVEMLAQLNQKKPVWVELGLQTMHEDTAMLINRGYSLPVFEDAVRRLKSAGLRVVVHLIIGLPGENDERIKETVRYLRDFSLSGYSCVTARPGQPEAAGMSVRSAQPLFIDGVKLQMLQVLSGTRLAELKKQDPEILQEYKPEEYAALLKELLEILPPEITVHRLTGDPPKSLLISPMWTADKKHVLNTIRRIV